jgi:hypothetical protein
MKYTTVPMVKMHLSLMVVSVGCDLFEKKDSPLQNPFKYQNTKATTEAMNGANAYVACLE